MLWGQKGYYNNTDNCPEMRQHIKSRSTVNQATQKATSSFLSPVCLSDAGESTVPELLPETGEQKEERGGEGKERRAVRWIKQLDDRADARVSSFCNGSRTIWHRETGAAGVEAVITRTSTATFIHISYRACDY